MSAYELQRQLDSIDCRLTSLELRGRQLEDKIRNGIILYTFLPIFFLLSNFIGILTVVLFLVYYFLLAEQKNSICFILWFTCLLARWCRYLIFI